MAKLPFDIEEILRLIAPRISTNTSDFDGSPAQKRWAEFAAGGIQILAIVANVDGSDQKLLALLDDSDRRVMVLSILCLGLSNSVLDSTVKSLAIQKVYKISATNREDQTIGVACGLCLAQLDHPPAVEWAQQQMKKLGLSSLDTSLRRSQEVVLYYFSQGWR